MATRTFTNGGVDNLWTTAGNWDTPPVDNDAVVIAAGQTCEYDGDMSNAVTWPNGIAGLTITGTLKLSRTAGTYYLKIKAATTINGAGTFDCGTSGDAIPFAAKHTITGGASWGIVGNTGAGMTMTVYAAEPAIKTIYLTALEPIGETVLAVDTDVTSDIWADGDTIRIDDINQVAESEERVIAAGGRAAGTITITAGLTAAKSIGALLHLISRNVKFLGVGAGGVCLTNFQTANKLTIAGGQFQTANYRCMQYMSYTRISGGTFSGNAQLFYGSGDDIQISGGIFSGAGTIFNQPINGARISGGTFSGGGGVQSYGGLISGGLFAGNTDLLYGSFLITGGTFRNNRYVLLGATATIKNATFTANSADIRLSTFTAFNTVLGSSTPNSGYTLLAKESYAESIDHGGTAGAFKSWTKGGVTSSQAVTVPTGYTTAMQTVLANATNEGFWQKEVLVAAGASVNITMNLRKDGAMTYLPRCIVFNKAATDPFAGGAGIHTFTMTDSVDTWEAETYTYSNNTANDITIVIRFQGMNASGNMFSALTVDVINVDLTAALALLNTIDQTTRVNGVVLSAGAVDAILDDPVEGAYTMRQALRIMLASLAGKATGGGTATITFRDINDTADRITATVDINGNRSAVMVVV